MSERLDVGLEVGRKKVFAWAVEWPGWCRAAGDEDAAMTALLEYRPRYQLVAKRAGLRLPPARGTVPRVAESVPGDATTDFGAPHIVTAGDRRRIDAAGTRRLVSLVDAAWEELAAVVAAAPASLRKGPRGGGRDRDAMVSHVVNAERAYASKGGAKVSAAEMRAGGVELLRARLRDALRGSASAPAAWPPRYLARRVAWHALDHAWEIEDRSD